MQLEGQPLPQMAARLMQVSRQMDAQFERRHREVPEMVYGIIFDANWRSLSQPKLLVGTAQCSTARRDTAQHGCACTP